MTDFVDVAEIAMYRCQTCGELFGELADAREHSRSSHKPQPTEGPPEYLTTAEVAGLCRTSPATVRYWRHTGYGPGGFGVKVGRNVLYPAARVREWLDSLTEGRTT